MNIYRLCIVKLLAVTLAINVTSYLFLLCVYGLLATLLMSYSWTVYHTPDYLILSLAAYALIIPSITYVIGRYSRK